jgi:hypothetical protein
MPDPNEFRSSELSPRVDDADAVAHFDRTFGELSGAPATADPISEQTMLSIGSLASAFANAMIEHQMPVTHVIDEEHEEGADGIYTRNRRRGKAIIPAWIVVSRKNLSGESMSHASVGHQTYSRSLLSGTPNNFRTTWSKINPDKIGSYPFKQGDELRFHADAVAVTGLGKLLHVSRYCYGEASRARRAATMKYAVVGNGEVEPNILFGDKKLTERTANSVVAHMRDRLDETAKRYKETQSYEDDEEIAERGLEYYFSTSDLAADAAGGDKRFIKTRLIRRVRKMLR